MDWLGLSQQCVLLHLCLGFVAPLSLLARMTTEHRQATPDQGFLLLRLSDQPARRPPLRRVQSQCTRVQRCVVTVPFLSGLCCAHQFKSLTFGECGRTDSNTAQHGNNGPCRCIPQACSAQSRGCGGQCAVCAVIEGAASFKQQT